MKYHNSKPNVLISNIILKNILWLVCFLAGKSVLAITFAILYNSEDDWIEPLKLQLQLKVLPT